MPHFMYNIEIKFNLGDIVWFLWNNKVSKGIIKEVTARVSEKQDAWRCRTMLEKTEIRIVYFFKEETGTELPCSLDSQLVFGSKESLIESL